MDRAYYLDRLRVFLIVLVIFHHSIIAFGVSGGWYYTTPFAVTGVMQPVLTLFAAINQAFFMSLLFFVSALLMPVSFDRKGFGKFLKDRLVRLGIPLAIYTFLINPALAFAVYKYLDVTSEPWHEFVRIIYIKDFGTGPMWFVLALCVFEILYALYRRFLNSRVESKPQGRLPSVAGIIFFMIGTGLLAFGVRLFYPTGKSFLSLQFGYFVRYVFMYVFGVVANRNNWLERFTLKQAGFWLGVSLTAIVCFMAVGTAASSTPGALSKFSGGMNPWAFFYAMWEPVVCVGFCFFLLMFFKKRLNVPGKPALILSADSYTVYIIHPVIVIGLTMLSEQVALPAPARLFFVLITGIPICFLIAHFIRKIPGATRAL